ARRLAGGRAEHLLLRVHAAARDAVSQQLYRVVEHLARAERGRVDDVHGGGRAVGLQGGERLEVRLAGARHVGKVLVPVASAAAGGDALQRDLWRDVQEDDGVGKPDAVEAERPRERRDGAGRVERGQAAGAVLGQRRTFDEELEDAPQVFDPRALMAAGAAVVRRASHRGQDEVAVADHDVAAVALRD